MPSASFHFPKGFLWGCATAAHQVEGNNTNNNWYRWEQEGHTKHTSGLACDWWGGRWKEDFNRAAEAGQNAHRLSVEWSRIQPAPDRWDEDALERYRAMLRGLHERGMTPLVSLHHFTDPLWLSERGGWESEAVVPLFEKFVRKTVEALKEYCTLWCTINEPNIYALSGYLTGDFPPGKQDNRLAVRVLTNMLRGHAAAYRTIHQIQPEARVGYALHYRPQVPANPASPLDRLMRNIRYSGINLGFPTGISTGVMRTPLGNFRIPEAKGTQDYLGLNYYSVDTVAFDLRRPRELFTRAFYPKDADLSPTGFIANIPEGLFESIRWAQRTYPNLPILITENGVEDPDDRLRPRYLVQHIHQMWRAVNFNWPVKGYFHWSLVDNFEWERGWTQRFGLWGLDPETQKRIRRPSVDLYAAICKENGLTSEMVQQYCPEVFETIFPG
ncbi:MAG: glycoside hydrolase family 1 protein [Anaerolineales bacterium]|nr:glycoside hydrolase family 1 protein [Anaerolineales bacterium]MDW8227325.1 glycoside hydrolase family 1 protein [Anaerolineales bacterium]